MVTVIHNGLWTRQDRAAASYRYLPVEVPPGTDALVVRLSYDRSAGVLDLGCFGPNGFRGWSGAAREEFLIGPRAATPGYLPGPLEPGTWQVMLGLHRVGPDGVAWELSARTGRPVSRPTSSPPVGEVTSSGGTAAEATRPAPGRLPAAAGLRWLAGDLHAHSVHSDGACTVEELGRLARRRGLDFLAVTDHNTISHHAELRSASRRTGVTLLPGQEITTAAGHANAFGEIGWVDFRRPADEWLAETERRGGLLSVNHPLCFDMAWRQPMVRRPPLAEIWHWTWLDRRWGGPIAWWQAWAPTVTAVGGSDFHRTGSDALPGAPTTWIGCDTERVKAGDVTGAVLAGLRAGRVAVSAGYREPLLLRIADELVCLDAAGLLLADADGRRTVVHGDRRVLPIGHRSGPYRLEDNDTAVIALAN